jgi:diphthine-ammonia ligase
VSRAAGKASWFILFMLGQSLAEMHPLLMRLHDKFGIHICGEGGEYETLTLDCPLFKKKIVLVEVKTVIHSDDYFAPVAYLKVVKAETHAKESVEGWIAKLQGTAASMIFTSPMEQLDSAGRENVDVLPNLNELELTVQLPTEIHRCNAKSHVKGDNVYISGVDIRHTSAGDTSYTLKEETDQVMELIQTLLKQHAMTFSDVIATTVYVKDMSKFSQLNAVYGKYFGQNPPSRTTVQAALDTNLQIDLIASKKPKDTLHVQGTSYWAPANIGPYSQATSIDNIIYMAGQIGLKPCSMQLPDSFEAQLHNSINSVHRVATSFKSGFHILLQCVCYVTSKSYITAAKRKWMRYADFEPLFVVVPGLPRNAKIEWATRFAKDNEEGDYKREALAFASDNNELQGFKTSCSGSNCVAYTLTAKSNAIGTKTLDDGVRLLALHTSNYSTIRLFHLRDISQSGILNRLTNLNSNIPVTCVPVEALEHGYIAVLGYK